MIILCRLFALFGLHNASLFLYHKWLNIGVDVYFTNVNGLRIHYTVSNRENVDSANVDQMIENSKNSDETVDWDLTLFTCTTDGQARCIEA